MPPTPGGRRAADLLRRLADRRPPAIEVALDPTDHDADKHTDKYSDWYANQYTDGYADGYPDRDADAHDL